MVRLMLVGFLITIASSAGAQSSVIDGDTLRIGPSRVRLAGIDSPELDQQCADGWKAGQEARLYLGWLISARPVTCDYAGHDRYGRQLGTCYVPPLPPSSSSYPVNLNRAMVRAGMAFAYVHYSRAYVDDESAARSQRKGVWAHQGCELPWLYRREKR